MLLQKLHALNFRSYSSLTTELDEKFNVFVGLNGQGKTNALDIVYYLCLGKSYFSSGDRHVVKNGESEIRLEGVFKKRNRESHVNISVVPGTYKTVTIDQKKLSKLSEHIGRYPCVMIAPADILLLIEGSAERRKLMDQCISQFDGQYLKDLIDYNRFLKQRNALLKAYKETRFIDDRVLDSFTQKMAPLAKRIYDVRHKFIDEIQDLFKANYNKISGNAEDCSIVYTSSISENPFFQICQANKEKDLVLGRTSEGIHKDDLVFKIGESRLKPYASQGQLKSFIVALKLSEYQILKKVHQFPPILILDDLFDKLDRDRISHLLELLNSDDFGQVFISDTEPERIPGILETLSSDFSVYEIKENSAVKYA